MFFPNIFTPSAIQYRKLSIFICHLFVSGRFHFLQVLYDPTVLDDSLLEAIHSKCPNISSQTIDIASDFESIRLPPNDWDGSDDILQLIFVENGRSIFTANQSRFLDHFRGKYRICMFRSKDDVAFVDLPLLMNVNSMYFGLFHDSMDGGFEVHLMNRKSQLHVDPVLQVDPNTTDDDDQMNVWIFDEYEKRHNFRFLTAECERGRSGIITISRLRQRILAKYFVERFNFKYVPALRDQYYNCIPRSQSDNFMTEHLDRLDIPTISLSASAKETKRMPENCITVTILLHTTDRKTVTEIEFPSKTKYYIMFHYKQDYYAAMHYKNFKNIFESSWPFPVLPFTGFVSLYLVRRRYQLGRGDFVSTALDTIITWIGGGNLQYQNRAEKIIFPIFLFGGFLINTIALDNFLYQSFLLDRNERIDNIQKLIAYNASIYAIGTHAKPSTMDSILRSVMGPQAKFDKFSNETSYSRSYATVNDQTLLMAFENICMHLTCNFDVVAANLGEDNEVMYFTHEANHFPKRLRRMFSREIQRIAENGLHDFFASYAQFYTKLFAPRDANDPRHNETRAKPLRLAEMYFYFACYLVLTTLSIVVFLIELIVKCISKRTRHGTRNC